MGREGLALLFGVLLEGQQVGLLLLELPLQPLRLPLLLQLPPFELLSTERSSVKEMYRCSYYVMQMLVDSATVITVQSSLNLHSSESTLT